MQQNKYTLALAIRQCKLAEENCRLLFLRALKRAKIESWKGFNLEKYEELKKSLEN